MENKWKNPEKIRLFLFSNISANDRLSSVPLSLLHIPQCGRHTIKAATVGSVDLMLRASFASEKLKKIRLPNFHFFSRTFRI